jgi:two-component system chemotaxis response regulator CheB
MDKPIRVLVVDDSLLMRQMVTRFLTEAGMKVVATAKNGLEGLELALQYKPDVITLDVQMPEMDGLEMLKLLMKKQPAPVVMLSSMTQENAATTFEALHLGAVDFVGKPGGAVSLKLAEVKQELVYKVIAASHALLDIKAEPKEEKILDTLDWDSDEGVVIIGSSTGGPKALSYIIPEIPKDFLLPIVVVQHMPPGFTASLSKRLNERSYLLVSEAKENKVPKPGEVWIAPGGVHLVFDVEKKMKYDNSPPHLGVRPAVDITLMSAVEVWGKNVIGVILTGMGTDGSKGCRKVKQAGGKVIVQDKQTSVVYGMPKKVVETGLADRVCSLGQIAGMLYQSVNGRRKAYASGGY